MIELESLIYVYIAGDLKRREGKREGRFHRVISIDLFAVLYMLFLLMLF